ncbi:MULTISPECIES: hypothetical protein [Streptacidiphilus]|uniref:Uncharacterized protein n=1 Tax=Streptacidiphilus cavernicola TaxID=3342716 RepID=A0ABV6UYB5_9ACTN|nr:hypothetical protein [Streptacidiphilus jeojiense]
MARNLVLASADQGRIGPGLFRPELVAILDAPEGAAGVHARLLPRPSKKWFPEVELDLADSIAPFSSAIATIVGPYLL